MLVLERVHRRPEPVVRECCQLALLDQPLERLLDEVLAFFDVVEELTAEDEEAGVDPEIERRHVLRRSSPCALVELDDVEVVCRARGEEEADVVARLSVSIISGSGASVRPSP